MPETRKERRQARGIPSQQLRKYIYDVAIAAGPVIVFYGLLTAEEVALWLGLGATILGTPAATLARANVR